MHIHILGLERFRGTQGLGLNFHEKLNVFVGMNGAGKSTILDAAAILLSWLVNRINHSGTLGRPITEPDIRNGEPSAPLMIFPINESSYFAWNLANAAFGWGKMSHGHGGRSGPPHGHRQPQTR